MPTKIITMYCFFDELLKALPYRDDPQTQLTTAEIMTVAAVAAEFFTGNHQMALNFLTSHHYIHASVKDIKPFSKSRFNRRLHQIPESLWQLALFVLAQIHQQNNAECLYIVDTFPVPACRNCRINRCKIYRNEAFRGYCVHTLVNCASKREYFYGLKVCLVVTEAGQPVEMLLVPGATADINALRNMNLCLCEGGVLFGDSGFLDRDFETALQVEAGVDLIVPRRKNMKEQLDACLSFVCGRVRKRVETTFSQLTERMAPFAHLQTRSIHAVTPRGFELKTCLTVLAFSLVG